MPSQHCTGLQRSSAAGQRPHHEVGGAPEGPSALALRGSIAFAQQPRKTSCIVQVQAARNVTQSGMSAAYSVQGSPSL